MCIRDSLQTGVIDAAEWIGPYNDFTFGLHQAAKYYYYPGWHEPGAVLETLVNKDAFETLPADLQSILKVAARAVNQDMLDEYTARNNQALETLVNDHDVQLRKLPDDVLRRFIETGELAPEETSPSVAPSMDIQIPSSLESLIFDFTDSASDFYTTLSQEQKAKLNNEEVIELNHVFSSNTFSDDVIKGEIKSLFEEFDSIFVHTQLHQFGWH